MMQGLRIMTRKRRRLACTALLLAVVSSILLQPAAGYLQNFLPEWNHQQIDMTEAKQEFLSLAGENYGYGGMYIYIHRKKTSLMLSTTSLMFAPKTGLVDMIRAKDTPHLTNQVYLDWTGSAVYRASQVDAMANDLKHHLYGNTHSHNPSSILTEQKVEEVRSRIVTFFNTRCEFLQRLQCSSCVLRDETDDLARSAPTAAFNAYLSSLCIDETRTYRPIRCSPVLFIPCMHDCPKSFIFISISPFNPHSLSEYSVIFTSGATAALHLLSETFPWSKGSRLTYLEQSHNSVLGIRELCLQHGGDFCAVREGDINGQNPESSRCIACGRGEGGGGGKEGKATLMPLSSSSSSPNGTRTEEDDGGDEEEEEDVHHLFAFPAEDNFSGVKYDLEWIERIQQSNNLCGKRGKWRVLLDAAAFVPTNRLDLGRYKPDFVSISFYKMFGFPTGLGCLLVHNRAVDSLRKVYWGGGSVVMAMTSQPITIFKMNPCAKYEDGTLNFLSIQALNPGFDSFEELGIERISRHVDEVCVCCLCVSIFCRCALYCAPG